MVAAPIDFSRYAKRVRRTRFTRVRGRVTEMTGLIIKAAVPGVRIGELVEIVNPTHTLQAEVVGFRDKEVMKQRLDDAGIRTPKHANAFTVQQCRDAAERIGFPLIIKPIAGAGSRDTYRIDDEAQLEAVLPKLGHVPEVSVEEFIDGEDCTFDTVCIDGEVAYHNIAYYRPRALIGRSCGATSSCM